jgi:alpha-L-glutamate ligase-like protein
MIRRLRFLSQHVLGLNRRDHALLSRYNPRSAFQIVDHKLKAKAALTALGIPVVETLATYRFQYDIRRFAQAARAWHEFVIKPAQGAGGQGVVIVTAQRDDAFRTSEDRWVPIPQMESHLSDILGGVFSLNQRYDEALIERRLHAHPALARLSFRGLPDIRVLVFRGVPLMAMLRLATLASKGRANLHARGIGVGVDLVTGRGAAAVLGNRFITRHPDSEQPLCDVQIPHWDDVLYLAARCADAVALGLLGVDVTLDTELGPRVLELNARPGLTIQLANRRGLRPLIDEVERTVRPGLSAHERVRLGQRIARMEAHLGSA